MVTQSTLITILVVLAIILAIIFIVSLLAGMVDVDVNNSAPRIDTDMLIKLIMAPVLPDSAG